jgi:uncharacterized protein YbjT (DUF2867 family)
MILVTGANGLNGSALLRCLSSRGVPARALVRSPEKAGPIASLPGVEVVQGDLSKPDSLGPALHGITRAMLISSSSPDMLDVQSSFIDAAARAGVHHVVKLSGIMPEVDSPFRFARMHGQIEKKLEASGMAFTHLRSGEFMHAYFRQVPVIISKGILPLPMADARIASIDVDDLALVAATVLTEAKHEGKTYPLTGSESLTMAEVAERLSRVTGKAIRYVDVPPAESQRARLAAGMPPYLAEALDELFAERRRGKEAVVSPVLREVFGVRATLFEEFVARHAAIFRGEQPPPKA